MSTPAAPETFLSRFSHFVLKAFVLFFLGMTVLTVVASVLVSIDWRPVLNQLGGLLVMLGFLYWTSTLLPGPVKRVGKAAGRGLLRSIQNRRKRQ
jgi:hypothetical protein